VGGRRGSGVLRCQRSCELPQHGFFNCQKIKQRKKRKEKRSTGFLARQRHLLRLLPMFSERVVLYGCFGTPQPTRTKCMLNVGTKKLANSGHSILKGTTINGEGSHRSKAAWIITCDAWCFEPCGPSFGADRSPVAPPFLLDDSCTQPSGGPLEPRT